ncbi:MAG: YecH family metal-binding protein [Candidatus Omnitrophota bacterium]
MNEQIHGHDVLNMMMASGKTYTRDSLQKDIEQKFGAKARFYTCSAENMTASDLISFLETRGKFQTIDGQFTTDPSKVCSHDGPHEH